MTAATPEDVALDADDLERLREILVVHDVSVGLLFGSAAHPDADPSDLDLAVEFADRRPDDEGYASAYFRLRAALTDAFGDGVDLADVHSLSARLAHIVFDEGLLVVGSPDRRRALEERLAGDEPSVAEARERVADAASRLREGSS